MSDTPSTRRSAAAVGCLAGIVAFTVMVGTARAGTATYDYTIDATNGPWMVNGINSNYSYNYSTGANPPVVVSTGLDMTAGNNITITYLQDLDTTNINGNPVQLVDANGYSPGNGYGYQKNNPGAPGNYIASPSWLQELVGTFADATGTIVGSPFNVGDGPTTVTVPAGAQLLLLGINDDTYSDNAGDLLVSVTGNPASAVLTTGETNGLTWTVKHTPGQNWNYDYLFTNLTGKEIDNFEVPIWAVNQVGPVIAPSGWICQTLAAAGAGWQFSAPGDPPKAIFGDAPYVVDCSSGLGEGIQPGATADFDFTADTGPIDGPVGYASENFNEVSYIDPAVPSPVPEPTTLLLLAAGIAAIRMQRRTHHAAALHVAPRA